jgi:hypothetical protein
MEHRRAVSIEPPLYGCRSAVRRAVYQIELLLQFHVRDGTEDDRGVVVHRW